MLVFRRRFSPPLPLLFLPLVVVVHTRFVVLCFGWGWFSQPVPGLLLMFLLFLFWCMPLLVFRLLLLFWWLLFFSFCLLVRKVNILLILFGWWVFLSPLLFLLVLVLCTDRGLLLFCICLSWFLFGRLCRGVLVIVFFGWLLLLSFLLTLLWWFCIRFLLWLWLFVCWWFACFWLVS